MPWVEVADSSSLMEEREDESELGHINIPEIWVELASTAELRREARSWPLDLESAGPGVLPKLNSPGIVGILMCGLKVKVLKEKLVE